jgi:hypothetical protein
MLGSYDFSLSADATQPVPPTVLIARVDRVLSTLATPKFVSTHDLLIKVDFGYIFWNFYYASCNFSSVSCMNLFTSYSSEMVEVLSATPLTFPVAIINW